MTSTTRPKRDGESEGNPYYFTNKDDFEKNVREGRFLEYAKTYNDQYYGVTHDEIKRVAESGKIGIWKIDWRGVETAKKLDSSLIAILITAPLSVLESRIRKRDNPSETFVAERMQYTKEFLHHTHLYDYQVENEEGKLDKTVAEVKAIIERHLTS